MTLRNAARITVTAILGYAMVGADCGSSASPESAPPPGAWLVLLCRTSDASFAPRPPAFYQAAFSKDSADLLWHYFDAMSDHGIDVSGSRVRGWFDMNVSSEDIAPDKRNVNTNPSRNQTAQDCRSAAAVGLANQGIQVDMDKYTGVISVINMPVDMGRAGGKNIVISNELENNISLVEHEMLHVYGLRHSNRMSRDAGPNHVFSGTVDSTYFDCWDIMSSSTCVYTFPKGSYGRQGPGIHAAHLRRLGWIPAVRVDDPGPVGRTLSLTLAPVSEPSRPGYLYSRIELPNGAYIVEYRVPSGFDRAIPGRAVLIREERGANKQTYLVTRPNGSREWKQGDVFTDSQNWVRISINDVEPDRATVSINSMWSPGQTPGALNEVCGLPSTGQTRPCGIGLRCGQRRTGQIVSVEYYCMP